MNSSGIVTSHVMSIVENAKPVSEPAISSPTYSGTTGEGKVTTRKRSAKYRQDPQNGRAVQVMKSWLTASNVPFRASTVEGIDFVVDGVSGQEIMVIVASDDTAPRPLIRGSVVTILAPEVTHAHKPTAYAAFHTVTSEAGYGRPIPVDRGAEPSHRLTFQEDFELVVMRHREFRNAPNPKPGELEKYEQVVMNVCWWVYRMNKGFFERLGWEVEDLKSYAQVFAINFLHKYKIDDARVVSFDNERLMTNHLKQRLVELVNTAKKKAKNVAVFADTAAQATLGVNPHEDPSLVKFEAQPEDESYRARKTELNLKSERTRRTSATKLLENKLAEMPHDNLVLTLTQVQKSDAFCPETRQEAAKRLKKHTETCSVCGGNEAGA